MTHAGRKKECQSQSNDNIEPISLAEMMAAFPPSPSSETRLECLVTLELLNQIAAATRSFAADKGLDVRVSRNLKDIPRLSEETCFKYSHGVGGTLGHCRERIAAGEHLTIASVREDDMVIAYGIATRKEDVTEVDILDVDLYSRRSSGLSVTHHFSGEEFQIGVGHVALMALLEVCERPLTVDATHSSSRYIFKCFGFRQKEGQLNPCILVLHGDNE
ncbi:MAG: hypothetical protein ACYC0X_15515 [Pirellulaceae bacterium]